MRRRVLRLRKLRLLHRQMSRGISHPMVGLLARRLTGKYIEPESKHLTKRVEEIHKGAYDELIEQIMQKPITEMQELYNNREIEK